MCVALFACFFVANDPRRARADAKKRVDPSRDSEDYSFRSSLPHHFSLPSTPTRRGSYDTFGFHRTSRDSSHHGSEYSEEGNVVMGLPFVEEASEDDEYDRAKTHSFSKPMTPSIDGLEEASSSESSTADFALSTFQGVGYGAQIVREIMQRRAQEATAAAAGGGTMTAPMI